MLNFSEACYNNYMLLSCDVQLFPAVIVFKYLSEVLAGSNT